jgi:hypothetical protein
MLRRISWSAVSALILGLTAIALSILSLMSSDALLMGAAGVLGLCSISASVLSYREASA